MQTEAGGEPPTQPGSIGDLGGGVTLAGAIAAALFRRERTGKGAIVDNALYLFGIYLMSQSVVGASMGLKRGPNAPRGEAFNPIINLYRTRDDRWISLCLLMDRWWPDLARHLDREDLLADPRFADPRLRYENRKLLIAELEVTFASRDFADWKAKLATLEGVWAPLLSPEEVIADPQALENGFVTPVETSDGRSYLAGASPAQFDELPIGKLRAAPSYGEHSAAVLHELGVAEDAIARFRETGVIA
jgi:formyl-CoA transferase